MTATLEATGAVDVLARTIWGEARGEGRAGMQAVACVIMNRAAAPGWWGRNVIDVCRKRAQFSCWNPGDPNRMTLLGVDARDPAFCVALSIAAEALAGRLPDITHGATHYHALHASPDWAAGHVPSVVIGRHVFYTEIA